MKHEKKVGLTSDHLIIPVYLNENTVIDMLAVIEDGFSMVSEVTSSSSDSNSSSDKVAGEISTKSIINSLLSIQLSGEIGKKNDRTFGKEEKYNKIHTTVSLLSKLITELDNNKIISTHVGEKIDFSKIKCGDFVEIEGSLEENPMLDYIEKMLNFYKLGAKFREKPKLGSKEAANTELNKEKENTKQMQSLLTELKSTGTIDFILKSNQLTAVLSAQEKYLSNDNISEIIGGNFKVLGKVIKVCKENEEIDLLRKTSLNVLDKSSRELLITLLNPPELSNYNFPDVKFYIKSPAIIIIPIAIYA